MMLVTSNVAKTTARKPTASDTANLPSCASRIRSKKGSENLSALNGVGKKQKRAEDKGQETTPRPCGKSDNDGRSPGTKAEGHHTSLAGRPRPKWDVVTLDVSQYATAVAVRGSFFCLSDTTTHDSSGATARGNPSRGYCARSSMGAAPYLPPVQSLSTQRMPEAGLQASLSTGKPWHREQEYGESRYNEQASYCQFRWLP
ncbi:hypothetical protein ACCO45_002360 [Purpureocillium lilacinum]|uniref:Uncharacterized protein n=1 Tax=Purpureocillium lilacinum TaxID=33203 RepID=A0ACC4E9R7_PURLI